MTRLTKASEYIKSPTGRSQSGLKVRGRERKKGEGKKRVNERSFSFPDDIMKHKGRESKIKTIARENSRVIKIELSRDADRAGGEN